ncbi:hypothetical protein ACFWBN_26060 [Streptomyces sp. NPDC059989]|uniref:hypothetical protein n=1 Tax=Streptomyces sp. NPDC059989 TaxID=3347026 RepID=UPI0036B6A49D
MTHDLHTPAPSRSKRRVLRVGMALTSAAFISGAIALPASAATASPHHSAVTGFGSKDPHRQRGGGVYGLLTCKPGYVWRDSYEGDSLCVTPGEHDRVKAQNPNRQPGGGAYGPLTCMPGYVWRDSFDGDGLCVTPEERAAAKYKSQSQGKSNGNSQGRLIDNGPHLKGIPGL